MKQDTAIGSIAKQSIRLYPNPATTHIIVEGAVEGTEVRLINLVGRTVLSSRLGAGGRLDVAHIERGVYIMQISNRAYRFVLK